MDIKEIDKQFFKHIRPKKGAPKNLLDLDLNDVTVGFLEASCIYDFKQWLDCDYYEAINENEKDSIGMGHVHLNFRDEEQVEIFIVTDLMLWFSVKKKQVFYQFKRPEGGYERESLTPLIYNQRPRTIREFCALYVKFKFHLLSIVVAKRQEIQNWIEEAHNPQPIVLDPDKLIECVNCDFVHKFSDRRTESTEGVEYSLCPRCNEDSYYPEDDDLPF